MKHVVRSASVAMLLAGLSWGVAIHAQVSKPVVLVNKPTATDGSGWTLDVMPIQDEAVKELSKKYGDNAVVVKQLAGGQSAALTVDIEVTRYQAEPDVDKFMGAFTNLNATLMITLTDATGKKTQRKDSATARAIGGVSPESITALQVQMAQRAVSFASKTKL